MLAPRQPGADGTPVRHQSKVALGSKAELTLTGDVDDAAADEWFRRLWLQTFYFEQRFSRFLPDSELSQFNRAAGVKRPISPEFHALLTASLDLSEQTGGLYNPFILPALQSAGYMHSMVAAYRHDTVDDFSDRSVVPFERLQIGDDWASIPYGTAIDMGGIGKGFLADRLAETAGNFEGLEGFWFSLGGDVLASGRNQDGNPWEVLVEDTSARMPWAGRTFAALQGPHAVATSSVLRRKGTKHGRQWHHIIDPRTNRPSDSDVTTATVSAPSAALADVLATCAIILGSESAPEYVRARGATGLLLQRADRRPVYWGDIIKMSR